ncbi:MAG: ABC transporter ATP-binding protein [Ktedonobacterales bacterium]
MESTGLGKRFGRHWALSDCSFALPAGRIAALVGPNGAGKTTLLHLAMGLLQPSAGMARVYGRDPWREPLATLPRVGFVAQDHPLYRGFSVADTLEYGRRMNQQWDGELAEARLRRLGIPLDQRVGKLSGGQQAQVALAMALGKRPSLLLLDEPVASLDPLARRDFLRTLVEAATERGITTLLSSHIIGDLEQSCDYLIILSAARVQLAGDIAAVTQAHRLLIGPRADVAGLAALRASWDVVGETQTPRQTLLLARAGDTGDAAPLPAGWGAERAPLEEIVLAYLSQPLDSGTQHPVAGRDELSEMEASR